MPQVQRVTDFPNEGEHFRWQDELIDPSLRPGLENAGRSQSRDQSPPSREQTVFVDGPHND